MSLKDNTELTRGSMSSLFYRNRHISVANVGMCLRCRGQF